METRVKVWENEKCCEKEKESTGECFHSFFKPSQTSTSVAIKLLDYEPYIQFYHSIIDEGATRVAITFRNPKRII